MSFSPDGTVLASGSYDETIRLWDVASGQQEAILEGHAPWATPGISSVAFSPDGSTLASGSGDETVRLWDSATGKLLDMHEARGAVHSLSHSPDGAVAIVSGHGTLAFWDPATGRVDYILPGHATEVRSLAFSPDGSILASGHLDGLVGLWDTADGRPRSLNGHSRAAGHPGVVNSVAFSPDGATLASGSHTVDLRDVASGHLQRTLDRRTWAGAVAFSPDGTILASGHGSGLVQLWDLASGQLTAILEHPTPPRSLSFSPDGSTLASAGQDEEILLWDVASGRLRDILDPRRARIGSLSVTSLSFSPDGSTLAAANSKDIILLWDAASGRLKDIFEGLTEAQWVALGASWSWDDLENDFYSLAYSPDGATLAAAGSSGRILVWDAVSGRLMTAFEGHADARCVAFSPTRTILASGHGDGTIHLWDMEPVTMELEEDHRSIAVPGGFTLERWSWSEPVSMEITGNREFGTGVLGTTVHLDDWPDGKVTLRRYPSRGRELISRIPAREFHPREHTLRFDRTGLFGNRLFVILGEGGSRARLVNVEPGGGFSEVIDIDGSAGRRVLLEFTSLPGYPTGACIWQGPSVYWLSPSFTLHETVWQIEHPEGRNGVSPMDMKSDPTGRYDGLLTVSSTDIRGDGLSGLYQLQADGELRTLVPAASVTEHQFQGIDFSNAGPLGSALYVADAATGNIWVVSPRGDIEAFAMGFSSPKRVAVGLDGTEMWVTDETGLYRIYSTDPSDGLATAASLDPGSLAMTEPGVTVLQSNYPNPFNSSTRIPYRLGASGPVKLVIYNALGQPVRTLVDQFRSAGPYVASWDGRDDHGWRVANGAYLYRLQAGAQVRVRKMVVLE